MAQSYYDVQALKNYVAAKAPEYGLDPYTATKVWTGEGMKEGIWQSNIYKNGKREESYGPFQFYMGGGMGNDFKEATGLDPRDPKNVYAMADWAMAHAGKYGWGAWYAARDQGIKPWEGITRGISKGPSANMGPRDDPGILPQIMGGFQFPHKNIMQNMPQLPHMPDFEAMPGSVTVQNAGGPPPEQGLLSRIFGSMGKQPDPYWMKGKGWDEEAKKAYLAQGLQDQGWPSLRSRLG